jgi:hypothetical protein
LKRFSIVFYNLENFFDTYDDPNTLDDDYTPQGIMHWIRKRYFSKAAKIGKVIRKTGIKETGRLPFLIGVAEVENKIVLRDIIHSRSLKNEKYDFVHYESSDKRGMDVALIYNTKYFSLTESQVFPVELFNHKGEAYKTRDILYCRGKINQQLIHVFINHWPSRREGELESNQKRRLAAQILREQIDFIKYEEDDPYIIVMGDFNTEPFDENIRYVMQKDFFNPAESLAQKKRGSVFHHKKALMYDQMMFTNNFKGNISSLQFKYFDIYSPGFLTTWKGKFKHMPFRTYLGLKYQNGYSDHFPVYSIIREENLTKLQ